MTPRVLFFGLLLTAWAGLSAAKPIITQYYPNYKTQTPSEIDWKATDIAVYFVTVTTADGFTDPELSSDESVQSFVDESHKHGAKALFAVGGWSGSVYFSSLSQNDTTRERFANKLFAFKEKYGFDGVDIDWEYPGRQGAGTNEFSHADSAHFVNLLRTIRKTFGKEAILSAAVSVLGFTGPDGAAVTDLAPYAEYLNYFNLMTYDISGSWSAVTGPLSPLATCNNDDSSVQQSVKLFLNAGVSASQLVVGIPSYTAGWCTASSALTRLTVADASVSSLYQTPAPCSTYSISQMTYKGLISGGYLSADGLSGNGTFERHFDHCTQTPFLFSASRKQLISYDDAESAAAKANFVKSNGLGGMQVFDSDGFEHSVMDKIRSTLG